MQKFDVLCLLCSSLPNEFPCRKNKVVFVVVVVVVVVVVFVLCTLGAASVSRE